MSDTPFVRASDHLPEHLVGRLERELDEGEGLVWVGQPDPERLVWVQWTPGLIFAVIGLLFGLLMFFGAADSLSTVRQAAEAGGVPSRDVRAARNFMWIGGVIGVLCQLPLVWVVFFERGRLRRIAKNTVYAVTPARAIVLVLKDEKAIERDYRADELTHLLRKERADGSGDLIFESARGGRGRQQSQGSPHGFYAIDDVLSIEKLLRRQFGSHDLPDQRGI